jgi:acyl-CoA reductase-like NAD-dependent aldehyde dehydrogenase
MPATVENQARTLAVINPATLEHVAAVPMTAPQEVGAAACRARQAFNNWRQASLKGRAKIMLAARDWLVDHDEEIVDIICSETGKPRTEALLAEVLYGCELLSFYVKNAEKFLGDEPHSPGLLKTKRVYVRYTPLGVVGIIAPWNYPFALTFGEVVPALMAGNAVILKPSEVTPLSGLLVERIFRECGLPEGLMQTLCGYGDTGAALVDHCDAIAFTGSVATGKKVAQRAAERLIPVLLELGGKDPMIVLKDADLERAANGAVWGAFSNAGQICVSVERVYVEASIYEPFIAKVVEKTKSLRQGYEQQYGQIDVGAMIRPEQLLIVEAHVQEALSKGAKLLVGGRRNMSLQGLFYEPTVLVNVDHSMKIMREETFGPILPIMRVRDADEALRLANDSRYGLNASVWTRNVKSGKHLADRVESGVVCVNDCIDNYLALDVPFGGVKESGLGRRHGIWGIRQFCRTQTVLVDRAGLKREPGWFPYTPRVAGLLRRALRLLHRRGLGAKFRTI